MGIHKLTLRPVSTYTPPTQWEAIGWPTIWEALKNSYVNYINPGWPGSSADIVLPGKPSYIEWNITYLHSITMYLNYEGQRTSGSQSFRFFGFHEGIGSYWEDPYQIDFDSEIKSGTIIAKSTKGNDSLDLYPYGWDHIFGYPAGGGRRAGCGISQGSVASGWAKGSYLYFVVEFTPENAFIETDAITEIEVTSLKGNGDIKDVTGEGNYTERGFEYYKDGEPENVQRVKEDGDFGLGEYSLTIPDLIKATKYYVRAWAKNNKLEIVGDYVNATTDELTIINVKAENNPTYARTILYGNIDAVTAKVIERGFEYLIQDNEPGGEDTGIEIKETNIEGFEYGEYNLRNKEIYESEKDTIWWFRAYCLDDGEEKYKAETWMKNVPTLITYECTYVYAQEAKARGELFDKGSNKVTKRGFRIIKEYSGDLSGAWSYRMDGFEGEIEMERVLNNKGILIGFTWTGDLYRDSLHEDVGGYELGIYEKILGGGFLGEGFGLYLKSNDTYKIRAIAENQLGMGFGNDGYIYTYNRLEAGNPGKEDVGKIDIGEIGGGEGEWSKNASWHKNGDTLQIDEIIKTGQLILPSDDEIVSNISAEKTITLGTLPGGTIVTRIGIRLGRTMGCNEIHVFEDGEWGSGQGVTFFITDFVPGASYYKMPYIIINYGDYEEEVLAIPDYRNPERLEEWLTNYPIEVFPEVEDEDELDQTIIDSSVGDISYRTIIKEIKCEKIGEQSFIDRYGRRRSQTVDNHLIQSRANCVIIIDDYIDKFQILKQKYALEYDIPIPFEREDCILLGDGKIKYKDDGQGLVAFKADGEGEVLQEDFILAKIRKIDGRFISGKEAILNLELEV